MTTLNLQVGAGSDDADESATGVMDLTDAAQLTLTAAGQWAGVRFTNVTVPQGTSVTSATLSVYLTNSTNDIAGGIDVYAQAADNAGTFTSTASDISSRTRTTAKVNWTGDVGGPGWKSPGDLAAVVNEVFARAGWASGNALVLILDAGATTDFRFRSYEYDTTLAAKLDIVYPDAAGQPTVARARLVPGMGRPHGHQGW